jgi:hypothetical protein
MFNPVVIGILIFQDKFSRILKGRFLGKKMISLIRFQGTLTLDNGLEGCCYSRKIEITAET